MCQDCGCGEPGPTSIDGKPEAEVASPLLAAASQQHAHVHSHAHPHDHAHGHSHDHAHPHAHEDASHATNAPGSSRSAADAAGHQHLELRQSILSSNDRIAERNRGFFKALGLLSLNIVSSPGSGKTSLIQRTIERLTGRLRVGVIVGDLATDNDAKRLQAGGARAVQITTGTLCHLEAGMIARALTQLDCRALDLVIIENVGNLVCPASFDLGEELRVVLLSVTEGEDKPLKYPPMFHSADVVLVNKIDLATAVEFQRDQALANIRQISPHAAVFEVSARTGAGLDGWCDYLLHRHTACGVRQTHPEAVLASRA
jgi:hydrogenase nickel incorporation protein HypB